MARKRKGKKQRTRGSGTIYQRGDKWIAEKTISFEMDHETVGEDGSPLRKRRRLRSRFDTKLEAQLWLDKANRQFANGKDLASGEQELGPFLDRWLRTTARPSVSRRTYRSYESHVRLHLRPGLGDVKLRDLDRQTVQEFLIEKWDSGLSPATVERIRSTLRRALNDAIDEGRMDTNPATRLKLPRVPTPDRKWLQRDEFLAFVKGIEEHPLEVLFRLAITVGMRRGELLGLRWQDVDLEERTIHVRSALRRHDGRLELGELKSASSIRDIAIPSPLVPMLDALRTRQKRDRLAAGEKWQETIPDLVFTSVRGTPLCGAEVTREFKRMLGELGLPSRRFHDLRHTAATMMLEEGVDISVISKVLGHSSSVITSSIYAHATKTVRRDAADRMGQLLDDAGDGDEGGQRELGREWAAS